MIQSRCTSTFISSLEPEFFWLPFLGLLLAAGLAFRKYSRNQIISASRKDVFEFLPWFQFSSLPLWQPCHSFSGSTSTTSSKHSTCFRLASHSPSYCLFMRLALAAVSGKNIYTRQFINISSSGKRRKIVIKTAKSEKEKVGLSKL